MGTRCRGQGTSGVLRVLHRVLGVPHRVLGVPGRVLGVLHRVLGGHGSSSEYGHCVHPLCRIWSANHAALPSVLGKLVLPAKMPNWAFPRGCCYCFRVRKVDGY